MRAVPLRVLGEPEVLQLEEMPDPSPDAGEALVRLHAAALNHRDVFIRKGQYAGIALPVILGSDGAGEVVETGAGVDATWRGREVIIDPSFNWGDDERAQGPSFHILGLPRDGTYAELVKVPVESAHPMNFVRVPKLSCWRIPSTINVCFEPCVQKNVCAER